MIATVFRQIKLKYKLLFFFLGLVLSLGGKFFGAWAATPQDELIILNYHQVNDSDKNALTVSPKQFAAELDWLTMHDYNVISPDEFARHIAEKTPLPPRPVLITFDDGYADKYREAFPILKERYMGAIIFLITDYIGTQEKYLTWEQVNEMAAEGIEFGSHTLSHAVLSAADPADAKFQLETSQAVFRWRLGKNARFLAYPCGTYDETVKKIAADAGFSAGFTVDYGTIKRGDDCFALSRLPIFGNMRNELEHFRRRLKYVPLIKKLYALRFALEECGLPELGNAIPIP